MKFDLKSIKLPYPNAVLYKDMKQKTKNSKLVLSVFLVNLVLAVIATIVMLVMFVSSASMSTISYSTFNGLFIAFAFIEFTFVSFITPSLTASSLTVEIEKQTFDVLLSTRLTPMQIILGKFWSSLLQIILIIFSGLPIFSLVFIYGGISLFRTLLVLLVLMVTAVFFASMGLLSSSMTKKTATAEVLTFMFVFAALFGTMSIFGTAKGLCALIAEIIYDAQGIRVGVTGDIFAFILYLNPLTTIYDVLAPTGLDIFGSSDPGTGAIISLMTDYSRHNILLKGWSFFGIAAQLGLTYLFLRIAARNIDPLRKRKVKKVKANGKKRKKQTA